MEDPALLAILISSVAMANLLAMRSIRQINQWETVLKFTFGKFSGRMHPGLNVVIPFVQSMARIDTRIRNRYLPQQMVITKDNVTAAIDAVVYYKVVDA